jgi:hypothetical protein
LTISAYGISSHSNWTVNGAEEQTIATLAEQLE